MGPLIVKEDFDLFSRRLCGHPANRALNGRLRSIGSLLDATLYTHDVARLSARLIDVDHDSLQTDVP